MLTCKNIAGVLFFIGILLIYPLAALLPQTGLISKFVDPANWTFVSGITAAITDLDPDYVSARLGIPGSILEDFKVIMTAARDETKERFVPFVIEPSGGVDRATLAFLCEAYTEDQAPDENGVPQPRTVLKLHPRLAPVKLAVFPLVKKDAMPEVADRICRDCQKSGLVSFYDEKGAVGRRYRRQDEAGTPFCITVDGQTLQDQTVTVRDRDSLKQERIAADRVVEYVRERIGPR